MGYTYIFIHGIVMMNTIKQINVLHGHEKGVSFIMLDKQNPSLLISGSDDCTVKLWDLKTMQCQLTIHTTYVMNHFCQSPDKSMLCLPSKNGSAE